MSNWSLTWPLLPRLERALQHRLDHGPLSGDLRIPMDAAPTRPIGAAEMRRLIRALLEDADRRGATDRDMSVWLHRLIAWLEPPACEMDHCEHAGGVGSFCRCRLERVPGRCPIRRAYRRRVAERDRKARAEILALLVGDRAPRDAASVRAALGNRDPQNLRVPSLLEAMARDGLLRREGDAWGGVYEITDAGRAAAADSAESGADDRERRARRGEGRADYA